MTGVPFSAQAREAPEAIAGLLYVPWGGESRGPSVGRGDPEGGFWLGFWVCLV